LNLNSGTKQEEFQGAALKCTGINRNVVSVACNNPFDFSA